MTGQTLNVFDAASYIEARYAKCVSRSNSYSLLSSMKLQKLTYYSQAWSLVWENRPLFREPIEAWIYGPVVRELFNISKGCYEPQKISPDKLSGMSLTAEQRKTVGIVVRDYGKLEPEMLVALTHSELPWRNARAKQNLLALKIEVTQLSR